MPQPLSATRSLRLHAARLREPLVQVWLMAGMAVILVIMGHVRVVRQSGDWKNPGTLSAVRLLTAGPSLQWADDFAPAAPTPARPAITLSLPPASSPADPSSARPASSKETAIDWRGEMTAAASRPWKHLGKAGRRLIDTAGRSASGLPFRLAWTGDRRGNARLHALECRRLGIPDPSVFIIGNGSRSGDGDLETAQPLPPGIPVVITLVGTPRTVTGEQKKALGELLNYLEARFGPAEYRN